MQSEDRESSRAMIAAAVCNLGSMNKKTKFWEQGEEKNMEQIVDALKTYDFLANVLVGKPNTPTARYPTSSLGNAVHDVVECSSAQRCTAAKRMYTQTLLFASSWLTA